MNERIWVVVPAAGAGARMGAEQPKQYLPLLGKSILEQTLDTLLAHPAIPHLYLPISDSDTFWSAKAASYQGRVTALCGGRERVDSVLNALRSLPSANAQDWVLVHDVARPCLRHRDLDNLLETLKPEAVGGLLGGRVSDTMKRTDAQGVVVQTVSREHLWRAYTPQMFRYGLLLNAIEQACEAGVKVTDEASAIEYLGYAPRMVQGADDNIKVTYPHDLELAALFLERIKHEENRSA